MREVRHSRFFGGVRTMKTTPPPPTKTTTTTTMIGVALFAAAAVVVVLPDSSEGRRNRVHIHSSLVSIQRALPLCLLYPPIA